MALRAGAAFWLSLVLLVNTGCLVRTLRIVRPRVPPAASLTTATLDDLVARIRAIDQQIQTINATVDLEPRLGSVNKGKIDELKDLRAFVLIRKPAMFRMIGLYPVVRNRAFDMVTDGLEFKIHFPARNKFVEGRNQTGKVSTNKLENIRPQHIFDALVIRPPRENETAVLENHTDESEASYIVHILRKAGDRMVLDRNIWFERGGLRLVRQVIFNDHGDIVTDARYEDYQSEKGILFPKRFVITRPLDEYGVKLTVRKLDLNSQMADDKFLLEPPNGVEVVRLRGLEDR